MRWTALVSLVFVLSSCGGTNARTAQQLVDQWKTAGLEVANLQHQPPDPSMPATYKTWDQFDIPSSKLGGQILTCETKDKCAAIFAYFAALRALAGPYYYQSKDGLMVVHLNVQVSQVQAAKYEVIVEQ